MSDQGPPGGGNDEAPAVQVAAGRQRMPTEDPMPALAPTAARILTAAQQLLIEKGFSGLTLKAIADKSGENSAMVQYYFGGKAGLIEAMITSIVHDDSLQVARAMGAVSGDDLLPKFVDGLRTISSSESFRVFFDVLPYALRHEEFRGHMARVYDWYRQVKLEWLNAEEGTSPPTDDTLLGFAELMVAVVDGLAIQRSLDDDFDLKRPYALLEQILRRCLPELLHVTPAAESVSPPG
jgi:AcrR family transcriptional regulator